MEILSSTLKNNLIDLCDKYKNYFTAEIQNHKIHFKIISDKTKSSYNHLKILLDKITNLCIANANETQIKIKIHTNKKIKKKNLLLIAYSLIRYVDYLKLKYEVHLDIKLVHLKQFKIILSKHKMYMLLKSNINKNISLFLSDYLLIKHSQYDPIQSNDSFISTIAEISKLHKTPRFLRLPIFYINEEYDSNLIAESLHYLHSFSKYIELLCFDINYIVDDRTLFGENSNEELIQIAEYIFSFILHMFALFSTCYLIINLKIIDISYEFPIFSFIDNLSSFLKENICKKFIVNIKTLFHVKNVDRNNLILADHEKSVYMNRTVSKVGDYSKIYLFFLLVNKKFPKLKKKYVMLLISRYLLKLKYLDFSKVGFNDKKVLESLNINLEKSGTYDRNSSNESSGEFTSMMKYVESESESRNILFCKNFSPWDKK